MSVSNEKQLEVLNDHFKESFLHIRKREEQRDRLFLYVIIAIGFLFLEIQYSNLLTEILGNIKLEFVELNAGLLPISVFLSVTWVCLSLTIMKYCQSSVVIERQYKYLHRLENKISNYFNDKEIYCRESKAYLDQYPIFSNFVWIYYSYILPAIMFAAMLVAIHFEWDRFEELPHLIFDTLISFLIILSLALYKCYPLVQSIILKIKGKIGGE